MEKSACLLEIQHVSKRFNGHPALKGVSFSLEPGRILCLLGPSGCGKTSLLRIIAGLERPDSGQVRFEGRDIGPVPPHQRQFGMMFQDFALFPHKDVAQNVAFGLEMGKWPARRQKERIHEVLQLVGLAGAARRNVAELSGGERQRVALARSLAPSPRVLMLDEPFGSLDRALRERLMFELRRILKQVGVTAIFVTHDQAEAFAVSDQIAVMEGGKLAQLAPAESLYKRPATSQVARFLGFHNLLSGRVLADGGVQTELATFYPLDPVHAKPGQAVDLLLRPEGARLRQPDDPGEPEAVRIAGPVVERIFQGQSFRVSIQTDTEQVLIFSLPNHPAPPKKGAVIAVGIPRWGVSVIGENGTSAP
jgi:ABC-type Fe3+/spermidine/putrescine transport system ATPase subunit